MVQPLREIDPYGFAAQVIQRVERTSLRPIAAHLRAAVTGRWIGDAVAVYPGDPASARATRCARPMSRVHTAPQPVFGVVREAYGIRFIFEGDGTKHRAENFFPRDPHIVIDAREHGRFDKIARAHVVASKSA